MKVLFDTSVIVAGLVQAHPKHERAFAWLVKTLENKVQGYISAHTLAESYSVLSTLPVSPRILPSVAVNLLEQNIKKHLHVVSLAASDYWSILELLSERGLIGGITYDALLLQAARKSKVDQILTFNAKDFKRFDDEQVDIISP